MEVFMTVEQWIQFYLALIEWLRFLMNFGPASQ